MGALRAAHDILRFVLELASLAAAAVHLVATFALGQRAPGGRSTFGPPPA